MTGMTRHQAGLPRLSLDKSQVLLVFWTRQPFESGHYDGDCVGSIEAREMSPQSGAQTRSVDGHWQPQGRELCSSLADHDGPRPR